MILTKRLVLDILKPHHPDILEFARTIAARGAGYQVKIKVLEIDENTETLEVIIEGNNIEFELITSSIKEMGASLHSIDGVDVVNISDTESAIRD